MRERLRLLNHPSSKAGAGDAVFWIRMRTKNAWLVSVALLAFGCADADPKPKNRPEKPKVQAQPLEPKPVEEPPKEAESQALAAALLGGPKVQDPTPAAAPAPRPRRRVRRQRPDPEPEEPYVPEEPSGLSDLDFQSAIGGWTGMRRCLAENSSRTGAKNGALRVSFKIKADGSVAESRVIDSSAGMAQAIAPCVKRRARRIRFPTFSGESMIEKTAKFVF